MKSDKLILRAIEDYSMLDKNQKVLVAFSGGPDSVCLLSVLYDMGYKVYAAHMNHNMRDTALRDQEFSRSFCRERDIELFEYVAEKGSLKNEMDARSLRYDFFKRIMAENDIELLATAHNKNDAAETVLLHMMRGASTDGLGGIAPVCGKIIRPMIYVKKKEVYEYLKEKGLSYVTDETNLTDIYTRNKLRNKFIPMLEKEFNPSLTDVIADNSFLTAEDADFLAQETKKAYESFVKESRIDICKLGKLHPAIERRIIEKMWKRKTGNVQNLSSAYINEIIRLTAKNKSGSGIDLPHGTRAYISYGELVIEKRTACESFCIEIKVEEEYRLATGAYIKFSKNGSGSFVILNKNDKLLLRSRKTGDRFYPVGMTGSKKLSDYFTDLKIPKEERDLVPVLTVNDEIAAVCGYRCDRRFVNERPDSDKYYIIINQSGV